MQLTSFTDYSLRVLIHLALYPDRITTAKEIAENYELSRNHLVKVIHNLSKLQLISSYKGKNGGIQLRVTPDSLKLGELIRSLESNFALVECFNAETNSCSISAGCGLKNALGEALDAFFEVLNRYTLTDAVGKPRVLRSILRVI